MPRATLGQTHRIVIKLGSAVMTLPGGGGLDRETLDALTEEVAGLHRAGVEVTVVSSGAVALGMQELGLPRKPATIAQRQALAALGQAQLMRAWRESLGRFGVPVAQVLLTHADLANRTRYLNARHAFGAIHGFHAVPVVNENDTVAVDEIRFGDNDALSAQVANLVDADLLIMLTVDLGLYDRDPRAHADARLVSLVDRVGPDVLRMAGSGVSSVGTGGMATKVQAARAAAHQGIPAVIASGKQRGIVGDILAGVDVGTLFLPSQDRLGARKHWIGYTLKAQGRLVVDHGAERAVRENGKSLLPSGIVGVEGDFEPGALVEVCSLEREVFARGLSAYGAVEVRAIQGCRTDQIEARLGYRTVDEVIHRDDLVVV
ncbi:MAG: glutamate 5-kinase [Myxococcales bacterium]